jgi:hypothetical protein
LSKHASSEYKINNVDVPKPRGFEYLVKIGAVGNCRFWVEFITEAAG